MNPVELSIETNNEDVLQAPVDSRDCQQRPFVNGRNQSNSVVMSLQYHSAQVLNAIRLRERIQWIGFVNGYPLWTVEEDVRCRLLYPSCNALERALLWRTRQAIMTKDLARRDES